MESGEEERDSDRGETDRPTGEAKVRLEMEDVNLIGRQGCMYGVSGEEEGTTIGRRRKLRRETARPLPVGAA